MDSQVDEIIEDILQNYQKDLDESMKASGFVIYGIDSLYYHLNKISLGRRERSYIDSPKWLKN